MRIWNFDPSQDNLLVDIGFSYADPDPVVSGSWLIPANACTVEPGPAIAGKTQHFNTTADEWYYLDIPIQAAEPAAVQTPEEIRQQKNVAARVYLTSTDWYIIRKMETGDAVPDAILIARQAARADIID